MPEMDIHLQGGPWHDTVITDTLCVPIMMPIMRPIEGSENVEVGHAIYEPAEERGVAFWLGNEWTAIRTNI